MRTPEALETLVEYGIVEEVLRPLMSGKEAQIFLVRSQGELRVAKIYKEAQQRSFKHRAEYTEGRKSRNTRDQRAMAKHSKHGKAQDEAAWRSAEVNAIYRLRAAGVRVPEPYHFVDGVLVMELVKDADGNPAPRLGDLQLDAAGARQIYEHLLMEVVRMLCAGVVHGDLSEFNVLMAADGPVVIDFPQAVDPTVNQGARRLLLRDVDNLHRFLERFVRGGRPPPYAQEMWDLYENNLLTPETQLKGRHVASQRPVNTRDVLALIGDAEREHQRSTGGRPAPGRGRGPGGPRDQAAPSGPRTDAPRGQGPRGASGGQADGSRNVGSPRADGPRSDGPRSDGPRNVGSPRGDGPRGEDPRNVGSPRGDGPRDENPRNVGSPRFDGPRGEGPRHANTARADGPRDENPRNVGGPRFDGPRGEGPRNGIAARADGPRGEDPRNVNTSRNDGPRRDGGAPSRSDAPSGPRGPKVEVRMGPDAHTRGPGPGRVVPAEAPRAAQAGAGEAGADGPPRRRRRRKPRGEGTAAPPRSPGQRD